MPDLHTSAGLPGPMPGTYFDDTHTNHHGNDASGVSAAPPVNNATEDHSTEGKVTSAGKYLLKLGQSAATRVRQMFEVTSSVVLHGALNPIYSGIRNAFPPSRAEEDMIMDSIFAGSLHGEGPEMDADSRRDMHAAFYSGFRSGIGRGFPITQRGLDRIRSEASAHLDHAGMREFIRSPLSSTLAYGLLLQGARVVLGKEPSFLLMASLAVLVGPGARIADHINDMYLNNRLSLISSVPTFSRETDIS